MRAFVSITILFLAVAAPASASHGGGLPWAGGQAEVSAFEARAAQAITEGPVKEPVAVHCNGDTDWNALAVSQSFDPVSVLGYVPMLINRATGEIRTHGYTHLSPRVCLLADEYWVANPKPGQSCQAGTEVEVTTVAQQKTFWTKVQKRVRIAGKWKIKTVRVKRTKTVQVEVRSEIPRFAPCADYPRYVQAVHTIAHESMHLARIFSESIAECHAMQWLPWFAQQFGASPAQAREMADYYWTVMYPRWRTTYPEYWSAECRDGGPLDLNLNGTAWP